MRRSRAPSNWPGPFFPVRSWAGCTTNMFGFDLRQAQPPLQGRTNKTAVLDPAPTDQSWPVPAADRVNVRESLFAEAFNRLLQHNQPNSDLVAALIDVGSSLKNRHSLQRAVCPICGHNQTFTRGRILLVQRHSTGC